MQCELIESPPWGYLEEGLEMGRLEAGRQGRESIGRG